jgi:hypothetical protein
LGTVRKRLHGFVYALFTVTRTTLKAIDDESEKGKIAENKTDVELCQAKLASAFRDRMTEGQSYQGPNAYRKDFYKKVTQLADEVSFCESSFWRGWDRPLNSRAKCTERQTRDPD